MPAPVPKSTILSPGLTRRLGNFTTIRKERTCAVK
jgi:hypothetical protein